jgi:hypothetical protein
MHGRLQPHAREAATPMCKPMHRRCCPALVGLQRSLRLLGSVRRATPGPSPHKKSSRKITPTATGAHGRAPLASPAAGGGTTPGGGGGVNARGGGGATRVDRTPPGELAARLQVAQQT